MKKKTETTYLYLYITYLEGRRVAFFSQNLRNNKEKLVEPEIGYIKKILG